jgi:DNA-directed RNA polymerase subunit beta
VDFSIGNWECKCTNLKGLSHLRSKCRSCENVIITNPFSIDDIVCSKCGTFNRNISTFCNRCGDPVSLKLKYDMTECQERGMTYAAPLKVTIRLTIFDKDPDTGQKAIRTSRQEAALAKSADRERHLHHQRHGASLSATLPRESFSSRQTPRPTSG